VLLPPYYFSIQHFTILLWGISMSLINADGTLNKKCFMVISTIRLDKLTIPETVALYAAMTGYTRKEIANVIGVASERLKKYALTKYKDHSTIKERLMYEITMIIKERQSNDN